MTFVKLHSSHSHKEFPHESALKGIKIHGKYIIEKEAPNIITQSTELRIGFRYSLNQNITIESHLKFKNTNHYL